LKRAELSKSGGESQRGKHGSRADRRSGQSSVGMVLASLVVSGRQRLLILRSTGEIWPINTNDVQYIMPSSLISPGLADACWSPELVSLWAEGEEATSPEMAEAVKPMQEARRKAVLILRKVMRETERMCGKMIGDIGRSQFGGIEGVWNKIAPQDGPSTITAREVAEFILNAHGPATRITVKSNTLPAYAAHCLMMNRSDLFLADPVSMAVNGVFMVRSRAEREDLHRVTQLLNSQAVEDQAVLARFLDKAKRVVRLARKAREDAPEGEFVEVKHDTPDWTEEERLILSALVSRLYETRTIQTAEQEAFATNIMKMTGVYGDEIVDRAMLPKFLSDLGVIAPWDTLKRSEARELARRGSEMSRLKPAADGLLQGNELDELRHDFTHHKVFVIDDATASELDDGLSIERIPGTNDAWIHVHVADPTRYISLNSDIATGASFQGGSAYLPEGNVPLLPLEVVMKELSLGAEFSRDEGRQGTMTFSTRLSPSGEILDSRVRMGWIYKPRVVTYDSVNRVLGVQGRDTVRPLGTPLDLPSQPKANAQFSAEDAEDLRLIQTFAQAHRCRRYAHAGFEWESPSSNLRILTKLPELSTNIFDPRLLPARPQIYVGSPKFDLTVTPLPKTWSGLPATLMVAEMMIMGGRTAARFCTERNLSAPFRVTRKPTPIQLPGQKAFTLDEILAQRDPVSNTIDMSIIRSANLSFSSGEASMSPGHHWVMGITDDAGYVRATSPLRRFDDLLVHWQIKAALASEKGLGGELARTISTEDMTRFVKRSDPAQRKLRRMGITANEWWSAGLVISRLRNPRPDGYEYGPGWIDPTGPITGIISGPTSYGATSMVKNTTPVVIPALGLSARMPGRGQANFQIGQELQVKLIGASQWLAPVIDVAPVES